MTKDNGNIEQSKSKLTPEVELYHFKKVVRGLMQDASQVLAELELEKNSAEAERLIELIDHLLCYTQHLCDVR